MSDFPDDRLEHCTAFIYECLKEHWSKHDGQGRSPTFFLGLNGVQGIGKTTLVSRLLRTLTTGQPSVTTAVISIDDFYLKHTDQIKLASQNPNNPMLQHRGQPSTHDVTLMLSVLKSFDSGAVTRLPTYDKSAFSGQGDRTSESEWPVVNAEAQAKVQLVICEGWCVGFRPLSDEVLEAKWIAAEELERQGGYDGQLGKHTFVNIRTINEALKTYEPITDMFNAFVHIDAEHTKYVYDWRLEQESELRQKRGSGMTDEQVVTFVDGYYPAYELYADGLRSGVLKNDNDKQLELVVDKQRKASFDVIIDMMEERTSTVP